MKRALITTIFLSMAMIGFAQRPFRYVSPDFKVIASSHQQLAILPFDVTLQLRARELNQPSLRELEIQEGFAIQSLLETSLLRKKAQKGFKVSFQEVNTTNLILEQNNISADNIAQYSREQLANILGVDGIVYGHIRSSQLISNGASLFIGLAGGWPPPTVIGELRIQVADASNGEVLWRFDTFQEGGLGSSKESIANFMLRRAARRFPYKRL
ncbi:MAG: hypothetical protein AAFO69_07290 [Bacteroidota bacterium]